MSEGPFQQHNNLFITCMISMVMALSLLAFSLYIFPYLIWHWVYDIPGFISDWREWLKDYHNYTESGAAWSVFLMFFIPGLIASLTTYIITNILEKMDSNEKVETLEPQRLISDNAEESLSITMKVLILIALVIAAVFFAEWFFSVTL